MSNFAEPRDQDELEGTLLPVAQAVPVGGTMTTTTIPTASIRGVAANDEDVPLVASATPVSYFVYNDDAENIEQQQLQQQLQPTIQDASAVPLEPGTTTTAANDETLRTQLALGQRAGLTDNDAQRTDIARANRQIRAINYFTARQVEQANQRAAALSREENARGWQGMNELEQAAAAAAHKKESTAKSSSPQPKGTYGKEYQVGEYQVKEYDTNDYQISEYKSMYDS